ncbi:MAG: 6-pyruvoyl-tetrahydropterin synthase-related protein [Phormidesmis sp.]
MKRPLEANHTLSHSRLSIRPIGVVAVLAIVAIALNFKILTGGIIFDTDDLHVHLKWLQHFSHQLAEGSGYPRWLAGLNFGYGSPTFMFYPPAAMYLGSALMALGLEAERSLAVLMLIATFTAGIGFYLFGQGQWRSRPALCGALAYMSAPYMVYNLYHRGALAEILATSLLPFGLFFTNRFIHRGKGWLALTFFFALLSLTHLPSLLLVAIAWALYILGALTLQRLSFKRMFYLTTAPIVGFGLSSFYLIPAVFEKKLVNLNHMRSVSGGFAANLLPLLGGEQYGLRDLILMFRYGIASTLVCLLIVVGLGAIAPNHSKPIGIKRTLPWLLSLCIVSFLMSPLSYSLWAASPTLQMVQFPWRLMGLFALIYAGAFGLAVEALWICWAKWKRAWLALLTAGLLVCLLGWNIKYAHAIESRHQGFYAPGDITTERAEKSWRADAYDRMALILNDPFSNQLMDVTEYLPLLPNGKVVASPLLAQPPVAVVTGQAAVTLEQWTGDYRRLSVAASKASNLHVRTYNYPAWHAYINGKALPIQTTSDGLIGIALKPGNHTIELRYQATVAMKVGYSLSGLSILYIGFWESAARLKARKSMQSAQHL